MILDVKQFLLTLLLSLALIPACLSQNIPEEFKNPPKEFSLFPFWFWNDTLKDEAIIRQIADFEAHGVYAFVIHPRIGLPENIKWLSTEMIHFMNVAINEAAKRNMYVILYDEGMYPSGSSAGQVVTRNPDHASRGIVKTDLKNGAICKPLPGQNLITIIDRPDGNRVAILDQPSGGTIRGLHYIEEGSGHVKEESHPAGDILNPEAVTSFIELVYERYAKEFGEYFGSTILGIFTDEPSPLGRDTDKGIFPGNGSLLPRINHILGYDIKPFLADLWYNDTPDSERHRQDYYRAIKIILEESYYKQLGDWCKSHSISLMGHPAGSMDIGAERYFNIPGQDLVWRYVEPGEKALTGQHSTMAKGVSSAMLHLGLRRNSNELYGAYGHNLTWEEMEWLANWCFIRGQNLLIPHAFYYSIRGPRFDERPPDVGPNAPWWSRYKPYADACRRLSWLNTDSKQVCSLAILTEASFLPYKAARVFFENQIDFNYIEIRHLWEEAVADKKGLSLAGMEYSAIVIDSLSNIPEESLKALKILAENGRLIVWRTSKYATLFNGAISISTPEELLIETDKLIERDVTLSPPSENIRCRHIIKGGNHYYMFFNEEINDVSTRIRVSVKGAYRWLDQYTSEESLHNFDENITFKPYELKIIRINTER